MSAFDPVLAAIVDRCSTLRAAIDEMQEEKAKLEAELVASGLDKIDGTLHSVTISRDLIKRTVDWKAIAAKFQPSPQLVTAYTSYGSPYSQVRYCARKLP